MKISPSLPILQQISVAFAATLAVASDPDEYGLTEDEGYFAIFCCKKKLVLQNKIEKFSQLLAPHRPDDLASP